MEMPSHTKESSDGDTKGLELLGRSAMRKAIVAHSISMSVRSIIPRKNNENQLICLYFHINLRLKVEAVLKYYSLTHSRS